MADGINTCTPSFRYGSDIVMDYSCYVCEQNGLQKEAAHFCEQCSKFYCDTCPILHDQMFKTHCLLGREEIQRWPVAKATEDALTRCQEHNNETLTLFCEDHTELLCLKCVTENHRQCSSVKLITDVADDSVPTNLSDITYSIVTMIQQINTLQKDRVANVQTLQSSYENILGELVSFRQKINDVLDKLEKNTIAKRDLLHKGLYQSIQSDINKCIKQTGAIKSLGDVLQEIGQKDARLSYIAKQKCSRELFASNELVKELREVHIYSMKLDFRQDILHFLSSLCSLGVLSQYNPNDIIHSSSNATTITTKVQEDANDCSIRGISVCADDTIVVIDRDNKRIKLLDKAFNVICYLDMPIFAYDLSQVSLDEVVVTIDNDDIHGVEFYLIKNGSISKKMTLYLPHRCRGVTHSMGFLYITSGTALYQYSMTGQLLKKLYEDTSGEFTVYKTAVCAGKIYVANFPHHKLITLAMDGTLLSIFTDPDLEEPKSVHVTLSGQVLVCGSMSNTILQIDGDGQRKQATVATSDNGVKQPWCLYLNSASKKLMIGQHNILALHLS
ncbi:uncharacterized protein LOC127840959 [Dreissena polymorpha]|uniref:uncharacterized protein LOC127840959 n=1 Tax=Dreissena polymorpha TaxID=45954 RepID=UPI0022650F11|nr:uncharacterized protein LOC127840959 [Dreissena polymorpha]